MFVSFLVIDEFVFEAAWSVLIMQVEALDSEESDEDPDNPSVCDGHVVSYSQADPRRARMRKYMRARRQENKELEQIWTARVNHLVLKDLQ